MRPGAIQGREKCPSARINDRLVKSRPAPERSSQTALRVQAAVNGAKRERALAVFAYYASASPRGSASMHPPVESLAWDLVKDGAEFLIGAAAGWALKVARDRWRTRNARSFWRPFLSDDLRLAIGRFGDFSSFERSGLLGVGDAIALAELQHYLGQIGATEPQVVYADRLDGDALKHTLISLGGPDANAVTREAINLIDSKLRFGDPSINEISIRDTGVCPPRRHVPSGPTATARRRTMA